MSYPSALAVIGDWGPRHHVVRADALDLLRTLPDECADFCLCDPPYGLGSREPKPEEVIAYLTGESTLNTGGDFMGADWKVPPVAVWKELFRCLKPGAHLFAFAGTKTWDLISMGIRMAGFENRDTVAADHPALRWIQAQGMAKGQSVGKAIDKKRGACRPVVGSRTLKGTAALSCKERGGTHSVGVSGAGRSVEVPITAPATEEAAEWEGYGSCLAPTWEPVLVFRKPLEGTLANNALKYGVGPLNIDACRTYTDWQEPDRPESWKASGHSAKPEADKIAAPPGKGISCHPKGRWPKNTVMVHADGCVCVGTRKVKASPQERHNGEFKSPAKGASKAHSSFGHGDPDGTETVLEWRCVDGCPVALLDAQSGNRKSGGRASGARNGMGYSGGAKGDGGPAIEPSEGGASRFFPTFAPDPFLYCGKVSTAEREAGCEALPEVVRTDLSGRKEGSVGQLDGRAGIRRNGDIRNTGKCVKPQAFLRWLARLGGKPGGVGLVPYTGTGSEVIALLAEGMRVVGVEIDPDMIPIANARIAWWQAHPGGLTAAAKAEVVIERAGQLSLLGGVR